MMNVTTKAVRYILVVALLTMPWTVQSVLAMEAHNYLMVAMPQTSEKSAVKTLKAQMTVDAPPSVVWQALTSYAQLKDILPGYQKSQVLQSNGNQKLVDIAMKAAPLLPVYRYKVRVTENKDAYQLDLNRVSGDFNSMSARYKLISKNGGRQTLVMYDLAIDPGGNLPGTSSILKASTEKTFRAMQDHIEDNYRKDVIGQR